MYFHPETQRVFQTHSDFRAGFPQTSFPAVLNDEIIQAFGAFPVTKTAPTYDAMTQGAREIAPALVDGSYVQQWEVYALPPEQIAVNQQIAARHTKKSIVDATQQRLDDFARTRNYDGILSLCTYATSTVPKFAAEGQYGVEARDATWAKLYEMLAEVQAGTRPMPTGFADIEPELPVLQWPTKPE